MATQAQRGGRAASGRLIHLLGFSALRLAKACSAKTQTVPGSEEPLPLPTPALLDPPWGSWAWKARGTKGQEKLKSPRPVPSSFRPKAGSSVPADCSSPVARTVPGQAGPTQQRHQPHTAAPGTSTTEPAAGSSDTAVTHHTLTYPPRGDMDPAVPGEL